MKTRKFFYGLLIFVGVLAAAVVVITFTVPADQANKQASNVACVPRSLAGVPLVNGLGKGVKIPLFPGATRLTFADTGAAQYQARAYDSEILGFYEDRLRDLCWQKQEQRPNQIVYKNDGQELRLSLLPNPAGKTVIDYVVFTESNVLGQVRIAQTACTSEQMYCNGSCVPMGTSCPAPTSASSCTGGTVYCPSSSGGSGWCQYGSCPSSSTTAWPIDQTSCSNQGYFWCNNACQMTACTTTTTTGCGSGYYWCSSNNTCIPTSQSCGTTAGTYEDTQIKCTDHVDNDGDGLIDSADPGCSAFSTTTSTSCSSGYYWCSSNNACIPTSQSCGTTAGTYEDTQIKCTDHVDNDGDGLIDSADPGCSAFSTTTTGCGSGYYWCSSTNSCLTNSQTCGSTNTSTCPSGQYLCNGACVSTNTSCSSTAWPTDSGSCTSQAKFWCTPSGGGSGWCQSTACSTNYTSTSCPAGQWMCNNACISTTSSCNGYTHQGTQTTTTTTAQCSDGKDNDSDGKIDYPADTSCYGRDDNDETYPASQPPTNTACAAGYTWCASSQSCVNAVQPCYTTTTQTQPQPTTQQQQPQTQPQTTACTSGNYWCPSSNRCISSNESCSTGTAQPGDQYPRPPQDYRGPGGPGDQYGPGQFQGPSEEDMKRMKEEQFRHMKRGMDQFARGVTQMKRFVDRAKARLAKQGVGLPLELTNAMAKAPELLAKLKAAKDMDEFEDLMGDMQDIGMIMQEWGPKMGELERLGQMLSQISKDLRNMTTNFNRVKRAAARRPELAEALKEVEAMLGVMGKKATDAKALAKSDPEGALELVEDFYGNSEEYWNTVAIVDMVSNVTRGLSQANSEIKRAETRIRTLERSKQADAETIATLKEMLAGIKESLPELRAVLARRPVDYEEIKFAAESFWEQIQEFENLLAEAQGQSVYAPTVKSGAGIKIDIPEGFLGSSSGPGGGGGGFGGPGGEGPGGFGPGPGGPGGF